MKNERKKFHFQRIRSNWLGADDSQTPVTPTTSFTEKSATTSSMPSTHPLQLILAQLDIMQGGIAGLETSNSSATSCEGTKANSVLVQEDMARCRLLTPSVSGLRSFLDLPRPEEDAENPAKIFWPKDRKKKQPPLPMSLPSVKEISSCWLELEKNVTGNIADNGERLQSAPFNTDTFLPYARPVRRFYRTTSSKFATSFHTICLKSTSSPPGIYTYQTVNNGDSKTAMPHTFTNIKEIS